MARALADSQADPLAAAAAASRIRITQVDETGTDLKKPDAADPAVVPRCGRPLTVG